MDTTTRPCLLVLFLLSGCYLLPLQATECSAARHCPAGQRCDAETAACVPAPQPDLSPPGCTQGCVPCAAHEDCPSLVCDGRVSDVGLGTCVPAGSVVYVDNRDGTCAPEMEGDGETPATAVCTLPAGLLRVDGVRKRAVRLMPSVASYGPLSLSGRSVSIYGPGGPARQGGVATLSANGPDQDAVSVTGAGTVVLDGVEIGPCHVGLSCSAEAGASVVLRRSRIQGCADLGVLSIGCGLEMDRVLLQGNGNGALALGGAAGYAISNSIIAKNRSTALPAIKIASTGAGVFRFNTVVDNMTMLGGAIDCGGQPAEIVDSIVYRNMKVGTSQFQNGCAVRNSIIGKMDSTISLNFGADFVRLGDIEFATNPAGPMNNMHLIDRAEGSIAIDFFGNRRPIDNACDISAHEVKRP